MQEQEQERVQEWGQDLCHFRLAEEQRLEEWLEEHFMGLLGQDTTVLEEEQVEELEEEQDQVEGGALLIRHHSHIICETNSILFL